MVPAVTFHCYVELCVMYGFVCVMYAGDMGINEQH